ncbi:MAG: hypothetical protein ACOY31_06655 [Bacillota bacterium]
MGKVEQLVEEMKKLSIDELKEIFEQFDDVLDMLGWVKLFEVKLY